MFTLLHIALKINVADYESSFFSLIFELPLCIYVLLLLGR